jgi:hypothetical protein
MIEYQLYNKDYSPINRDNYEDISKVLTNLLPGMPLEINKTERFIRETRGRNGEAVHIYYRDRDIRILIPEKDEESIKERLEVLAELKFERTKCQ